MVCCGRRVDNVCACPPVFCCNDDEARRRRLPGPIRAIDIDDIPPGQDPGPAPGPGPGPGPGPYTLAFGSGTVPAVLTSGVGGAVGTATVVGIGSAIPDVVIANGAIQLTDPLLNSAQVVPTAGSVTSMLATFTVTAALNIAIGEQATVTAELYRSPIGTDTFTATGVSVQLAPPLTNLLQVGTTLTGTVTPATPVPVAAGDRLIVVYTVAGTTLATAVTGTASAVVNIA